VLGRWLWLYLVVLLGLALTTGFLAWLTERYR
jgi:hypothetical protein